MPFLSNRESPCCYCNRLLKTRDPIQGRIRSEPAAAGKTKVLYAMRRTFELCTCAKNNLLKLKQKYCHVLSQRSSVLLLFLCKPARLLCLRRMSRQRHHPNFTG